MIRRLVFPLLLLLGSAACSEAAAPGTGAPAAVALGSEISPPTDSAEMHFLAQATVAPALETYQRSFWAVQGHPVAVTVNYQRNPGDTADTPFLEFGIPKDGLAARPDGTPLAWGDSVQVTLSIDPGTLSVDFQPAGLQFSPVRPASLRFWFEHADPDLNQDGVVDTADVVLCQRLDVWYAPEPGAPWVRLLSERDLTGMWVRTALKHFSSYAISW